MRGIRIGVLYDLKDRLSGGLGRIRERMSKVNQLQKSARLRTKEYFGSFSEGIKNAMPSLDAFKNRNIQLFDAISERVPFLSNLGALLSNPYALALAAVVALAVGVVKLGGHMVDITNQIKDNQKIVQATFGITGTELSDTTAKVMALSDVLKVETSELSKAANTLQKEYADTGLTINDSLNLIKTGIQATNGQFDLEEVKEYASQMKAVGLNAEEFISLSAIGRKEGIFNDKAVDAVKEFNLRLKEMTPAAKDALKGIGLNADTILKGLNDGSLRTVDVLRQVSQAMAGANTQSRQTAIANLFGGAGEDAGERLLLSLGKIDLSINGITKGMEDVIAFQNQQIDLNERIRNQQTRFADVIQPMIKSWEMFKLRVQEVFYGVLGDAMEWLRDQWIKLEPIIMLVWKLLKANIAPAILLIVAGVKSIAQVFSLVFSAIRGVYNLIVMLFDFIGKSIDWVYNKLGGEGSLIDKMFEGIDKWSFKIKIFFEDIAILAQKTGKLMEAGLEFDLDKSKAALRELKAFTWRNADALYQSTKQAATAGGALGMNPTNSEYDSSSGNAAVATNSRAVRNITVNIQNLNEGGINLTTQNIRESANDIESAFMEMLILAVRNVEQTL